MPFLPGRRWPRYPRIPRFPRRMGSFQRQRAFWVETLDPTTTYNGALANNTLGLTAFLPAYTPSTSEPGDIGSDDFRIQRVLGRFNIRVSPGSNNGQAVSIHLGICIADCDATGAISDAGWDIHNSSNNRRWLWTFRTQLKVDTFAGVANQPWLDSNLWTAPPVFDFTPRARCRTLQRLAFASYVDISGGAADASVFLGRQSRVLLTATR